jgi:hypothetical protein
MSILGLLSTDGGLSDVTTGFRRYYELYTLEVKMDSTTLNRGQGAHAASTSHFGRLPRHLGLSAGGTGKLNNSSTDQR